MAHLNAIRGSADVPSMGVPAVKENHRCGLVLSGAGVLYHVSCIIEYVY